MEKLRFKNSYGEYSKIKSAYLGEVAQIKTGDLNVQDSSENGTYPFYDRSVDIKRLDVYSYDKEAIIYPGEGSEFYPRLYRGKFALHQRAYAIFDFNKEISLDYIYQYLKTKNNHFLTTAVGSTVKSLRMDCFEKCEIKLPNYEEQEKIGSFLSSFDKLIQKLKEKIDLLKEFKRGYLQQMFPGKGSKVPKIRFKGFADAWEQRKLGDMAESFEYGLNASATEYDGINKYLRITDIDEDTRLFKTDDLTSPNIDYNGSDNYLLKNGDILFARTGASVGKSYIYKENDGKVYFAGFLIRARIKSNYSPQFIYQTTLRDEYDKKIMITSQRSGQPGVNAKEYSNFEFLIPSYEEQVKIGEHFEKIDNLITLHQHKLDKLEEMKKGYMQRLFI